MSARIPAGYFETVFHFTVPGQSGDVITSLGWEGTPPTTPELRFEFDDNIVGIMGNLSEHCVMSSIDFVIGQDGADDLVFTETVVFAGEAVGNMMPVNNTYLMQKRTLLGGKRGRGRNYLPGVPEGAVGDDGVVDGGSVAGLTLNFQDMIDAQDDLGYTLTLFHQSAPFTPTPVSSINFQPVIATQRKRLRG